MRTTKKRAAHLARAAVALLLAACGNDIAPAQPLLNRCTQQFECGPGDSCHPELNLCTRERADAPYPLAIQVVPEQGGNALVGRTTLETRTLTGALSLGEITVPDAIVLSGRVLSDDQPREAELSFTSVRARAYLGVEVSARTLPGPSGLTYQARLEPNTTYRVRVYPLVRDSAVLPPHTFEVTTGAADMAHDFVYTADLKVPFPGTLIDENLTSQTGRKLRLREKRTGDVVSSLGEVGEGGRFTLYTSPDVLGQLASHELVIGLEQRREPWLTTIAVDGSRLRPEGTVTIPVVPAPVLFIAQVETTPPRTRVPGAEVTFLSSFVPPREQARVNDRDWCRARLSADAGITCRADISVPLRPDSTVTAELIPGDYQAFIKPTGDSSERPLATTAGPIVGVETQPDGGVQSGWQFEVDTAKLFSGLVLSPLGRAMPFVTVTAQALGLPGRPEEVGEVGRYNRTAEALSDRNGEFELAVDLGYYDFTARPPAGSGFASIALPNRQIGGDVSVQRGTLHPSAPVIVRGTLVSSERRPVGKARVDAYAVVRDLRTDGERALRIGQATSDDAGVFVLTLPPRIGEDGDDMDAGVALDGGTR